MKKILTVLVALLFFGCNNTMEEVSQLSESNVTSRNSLSVVAAPENLRVHIKKPTWLNLIWNSVDGAVSYRLYHANGIEETTYNFKDLSNLVYGETYNFYVTAVDAMGNESLPSATLEVTMDVQLTKPTGLKVTAMTQTTAEITWDLKDEPIRVYSVMLLGPDRAESIGNYGNSIVIENLTEGQTYTVQVSSAGFNNDQSDISDKLTIIAGQFYPEWTTDVAYEKGTRVIYNGDVYEAKWWSYNDIPGAVVDGAWYKLN